MPLAGSPGVIPFLAADATGSTAVQDIAFSPTVPDHAVTLEIEIAGWAGFNEFGWYSGGVLHKSFQGSDGAILNTSFSATGNFGFYLHSKDNKYVFSESSLASVGGFSNNDRYKQHFTLFRETPAGTAGATADVYWIGAEDVKFSNGSDIDFNDLLVKISTTPVPEPGSLLLLAASLAGCLGLVRRRGHWIY